MKWSATPCLVVGGAGNLGGCIVRALLEKGVPEVRSFDLAPYAGKDAQAVTSIVGNLTDRAALIAAMHGVHVVVHTASIIDIKPRPSLRMHHVNVTGTFEVVAACKAAHVKTLIYTSTIEVVSGCDEHGVMQRIDGVDESMPCAVHPHLPYGATKLQAERIVLAANSAELHTVAIRSGYIMGPNAIALRIEMLRAAKQSNYYVTSKVPARLSTVDARNCALAHLAAAERAHHMDVGGHAFFVRDFEASVVDMAIETFAGSPVKPLLLPLWLAYAIAWVLYAVDVSLHALASASGLFRWRTSDQVLDIRAVNMAWIDIVVSDRRAREVLGYTPVVSREQCMRETREWAHRFYASLVNKGASD